MYFKMKQHNALQQLLGLLLLVRLVWGRCRCRGDHHRSSSCSQLCACLLVPSPPVLDLTAAAAVAGSLACATHEQLCSRRAAEGAARGAAFL